jgi:hypothetical protein
MVFCDQECSGDKDTGDEENPNRKDYEQAPTASYGLSFRYSALIEHLQIDNNV